MDTRALPPEEVVDVYEDVIETYEMEWDRHGHRSLHLAYYDDEHDDPAAASVNTIRVLAEAAGIDADDTVLNVGCGAGEGSVFLANALGAFVHGVDVGQRQLDVARQYARENGVGDQTGFARDDFHELESVADGAADVYWALEALAHSDDVSTAIAQARRVLAPDGSVAVADLFVRSDDLSPADRDRLATLEDGLGVRIGPLDELEGALGDQDFSSIDIRDATDAIRPSTKRRRRFSKVVSPLGGALTSIGYFSDAQVAAMEASAVLHDLVADDVLGYFVVTADA